MAFLFELAASKVGGDAVSKARARDEQNRQANRDSWLEFEEFARNNPDAQVGFRVGLRQGPGRGGWRPDTRPIEYFNAYEKAFGVPKPAGYQTPRQIEQNFARSFAEPVGDFRSILFSKPKRKKRKKKKKKRSR